MAACAQNIKKIALLLEREGLERLFSSIFGLIGRICAHLGALQKQNRASFSESITPMSSVC